MRLYEFTTLSLVFSVLLLTASAEQYGNQAGPSPSPAPEGSCGDGAGGRLCREGLCCSKWGWCGDTDAYCADGNCQSQCPAPPPPPPPAPPGSCGDAAGGRPCPEGLCCSKWGWCGSTDAYCADGNCQSQCPTPSPPPPPPSPSPPGPPPAPPSGDLVKVIPNSIYDEMLKYRNDNLCEGKGNFYSYDAFIAAAGSFPAFGTTGDITIRKREIAAFFAQTSHETTGGWVGAPGGPYAWGYCFITERNQGVYCTPSNQWPCVPGRKYFGRGPIQLSHNYNYGPCGRDLGLDLLSNPDLVATNSVISFKSALWFWMTPQSPKPSCHDVIIGKWNPSKADREANRLPGFGVLTNIINGGLECGHGTDERVQNRIGFYKRYCEILGISPGDNLDCGNQTPFGNGLLVDTM